LTGDIFKGITFVNTGSAIHTRARLKATCQYLAAHPVTLHNHQKCKYPVMRRTYCG
jgi:hypothetical protein